jgi:hypothetical protein
MDHMLMGTAIETTVASWSLHNLARAQMSFEIL